MPFKKKETERERERERERESQQSKALRSEDLSRGEREKFIDNQ